MKWEDSGFSNSLQSSKQWKMKFSALSNLFLHLPQKNDSSELSGFGITKNPPHS